MRIIYRTKTLKKICENINTATRKYGERMAIKIRERILQISKVSTIKELISERIGRCHALTGDRTGEYAMDLIQPYRLIFTEINENIICVRIEEITDYH